LKETGMMQDEAETTKKTTNFRRDVEHIMVLCPRKSVVSACKLLFPKPQLKYINA
jgi:hypothetical protein